MSRLRSAVQGASLALSLAALVFFALLAALCIAFAAFVVLGQAGLVEGGEASRVPLFRFAVASLIVGAVVALVVSRRPVKPIEQLEEATRRIADGDYSVRVDLKGPDSFVRLGEGFNRMAEELGSVEMLRNDFVSTFSHELKTPIASIRGFSRMLQRDDVTDAERQEYLAIIEAESERLAGLSDAVLRLTKVEQQAILTDVERCDVSEQVRRAIAVVDERWSGKGLTFVLEGDEAAAVGNRQLLEQVWLNIVDNAAKFSREGGAVSVRVGADGDGTQVSVTNEGDEVSDEVLRRVFDKFYQGDASRSTQGNGLGLTLAKRIVDLHAGELMAVSESGLTTFTVRLPAHPAGKGGPAA